MNKLFNKKLLFLSLIILLFSLIIRIYKISSIPANINPDSADTLQTYIQFNHNNKFNLFDFNWNGSPAVNTYIIGGSWDLFNRSILGFRFPSVLISSLAVLFAFFCYFLLTNSYLVSFFCAMLLSVNPLFLNFSRDGWENIFNSWYLMITVLGMIFFFEKKQYSVGIILILVGSVLSFYGYHPGKLIIVISLIILVINYLKHKKILLLLILFFFFIIFGSFQINSMLNNQEKALNRIKSVSILNTKNPTNELISNIVQNTKGFIFFDIKAFDNGYLNKRYLPLNTDFINFILIPFFLIGFIYAIIKFNYLPLLYVLYLFPTQLFSLTTPDGARGVHILPLIFCFIAIGLNFFLNKIKTKKIYFILQVFIVLIFIFLIILNINIYFTWINKKSTLESRRPAILNQDFKLWYSEMEKEISQGKWGFTVGEWELFKKYEKNND